MRRIAFWVWLAVWAPLPGLAQEQIGAALDTCWSCHGASGVPKDPTVPIIWGQRADYLEAQLRAYRAGDRENQIMNSMAESLRRADIPAVAAFIAGKDWPATSGDGSGAAPNAVATCRGCHGAELMGGVSPVGPAPRLAGQTAAYLKAQMVAFAHGERLNQETMSALMKALDGETQTALASYLAGLGAPPAK